MGEDNGSADFVCFALVCLFFLVLGAKKEEYDGGFRYVQVSTCFFLVFSRRLSICFSCPILFFKASNMCL